MTPYYDSDGITIYHGACTDILPSLRGVALVTDPPYGINFAGATWSDSPDAYPSLIRWLVDSSCVVSGWCFVFQAMPNVSRFHEWFPEGWRIFDACKNFAQIRPTGVWHSWDPVVFWNNSKAKATPNSDARSGHVNRDYHVGNVAGNLGRRPGHPCPRPLDTMSHIVQIAAAAGETVIDPFMGSGTTLRAAKDTGRKAIGIEIEERYCEIAAKRLSQQVFNFDETH